MSEALDVQDLLEKASDIERAYDWLAASEVYEKALSLAGNDASKTAPILESLGYSLYRVAMQAVGVGEFQTRVRQASLHYEKARDCYDGLGGARNVPSVHRSNAFIALMGYWLGTEVSERKKLIDSCWALARESLKGFETSGDAVQLATTYNRLVMGAILSFGLDWNFENRRLTMKEAVEHGEKASGLFPATGEAIELARTHANTANSLEHFASLLVPDERTLPPKGHRPLSESYRVV